MEVIDIELIIVVSSRSTEAGTLVEGAETAAFRGEAPRGRSFAFFSNDRDHAAERIGAIQAALWSAQHLDALDVAGEHLSEIKRAIEEAGIAHIHAVDNELSVIGVGAAQENRGLAAG